MSPVYSFEYELDKETAARAAEVFVRAQRLKVPMTAKQWRAMGVLLLCASVSGALLFLGYVADVSTGILFIPGAFLGLFGGVLSLAMFSFVSAAMIAGPARWIMRRRLLDQVPDSYDRKVHWTFTEQEFRVHTATKDRQVSWQEVRRFLADSDFWFLGVRNGSDLILPVENLAFEVRELIRRKTANLPVTAAKAANRSGDLSSTVVRRGKDEGQLTSLPRGDQSNLPDTESTSLEPIPDEGARLKQEPWIGRFLKVIVATGVTLFLLQEGYLGVPRQQAGNLLVIGALMLGAGCAVALLVKRRKERANTSANGDRAFKSD
jgi:hypothetical protein